MKIPLKKLEESELTAIYQMTTLGGSIPSHVVVQLLGHIEMMKSQANIEKYLAHGGAKING